jgi:hypothetical protein
MDLSGQKNGPTVLEAGRTGPRERCLLCDKVVKHSQEAAEDAALKIWKERKFAMRPYFSRACGYWHLATDRKAVKWVEQFNQGEPMADESGKALTKYDEAFAKMAQDYTSGERVTGSFISTRGGVLTFGEEQLPGNQMCVIVLDYVQERTFYTEKFNADREVSLPPVCYAFKRNEDEEEMAPHPSMQSDLTYFQPQNDICRTCPNNDWGTADTGKGKACSERRRLALLPAGYYTPRRGSRDFDLHLIDDPEHYASADIAYLKLPVTSVKDWARYVTTLASTLRRPPVAVVTRIYIEPDVKTQFRVKFEIIEQLPDTMYEIIMKRHEEAKAGIIFGYPPPSGSDVQAAGPSSIRR